MAFNYSRARMVCDRQIRRFGGAKGPLSKLRRADGSEVPCVAARLDYKPQERGLFEDGASRILISPIDLAEAPDKELHQIVFADEVYNIIAPVTGFRQGGSEILFFDCPSMLVGPA